MSWRARVPFFVAVFFIFAPLALLWELGSRPDAPWWHLVAWLLFSGATAVGWAFAFLRDLRILFLVVPISVILSFLLGDSFWTRPIAVGDWIVIGASIACIVVGYAFFIRFIMRQGAATLRLQTEMNLARDIHTSLVPPLSRRTPRLEVHGASIPTTEVGGDLLDIVERPGSTGL